MRWTGLFWVGVVAGCAPQLPRPAAVMAELAPAVAVETVAARRTLHAALSVADDVIAVGAAGACVRFDGSRWRTIESPASVSLRAVWASGTDDVWVAGDRGALLHGDLNRLHALSGTTADLYAVAGASRDDVWIAGAGGTLLHFDGVNLAAVPLGTTADLRGIAALAHDDVRVVGSGGTALRFDGSTWSRERLATTADLRAVFARGPNDVWVAGDKTLHWDGVAWSSLPSATRLVDVWGEAETLWALGADGAVLRLEGTSWIRAGLTEVAGQGVWVARAGKAAVLGLGGTLVH